MTLLASVLGDDAVDRCRILKGFSPRGRGAWFHADLFAQPVPVAALNGDEPIDGWGPSRPTSTTVERTPPSYSAPAERIARPRADAAPRQVRGLHDLGYGGRQEEQVVPFEMGGSVDAFRRAGRRMAERMNRQLYDRAPAEPARLPPGGVDRDAVARRGTPPATAESLATEVFTTRRRCGTSLAGITRKARNGSWP
jgi:hypothetical protein